jgi:hypothetical protein
LNKEDINQRYTEDQISVGDEVYVLRTSRIQDEWDTEPWLVIGRSMGYIEKGRTLQNIESLVIARRNESRSVLATPCWVQKTLPLPKTPLPNVPRFVVDDEDTAEFFLRPPDDILSDGTERWHL